MKIKEILNKHGKRNREHVLQTLDDLGNKLFIKNKWDFIESSDSETISVDKGDWYHVTIGNRFLFYNCSDSECNRAAYVSTVKDMYHESKHVWQRTKAWNDKSNFNSIKSYRETTDIIRREFIKGYFPSVYTNNYSNDPSEMDAERYGIRYTLAYFESDPIITKTEAEELLYQFAMSEDSIHSDIIDSYRDKLHNIYDILDLFDRRAKTVAEIKYPVTEDIPVLFEDPDMNMSLTHEFLYSDSLKEYRKAFAVCSTGIEQDKILEQVILVSQPGVIRKAPLRLRIELLDCQNQMELSSLRPGPHAISPKKINYSVQPSEELELTDEDLASIPIDDSIYL